MVDQEEAPLIVRALTNIGRRQLAQRYGLEGLLLGRDEERYLDWVRDYEAAIRKLTVHKPTSAQLKKLVTHALAFDGGFVDHLLSKGITDFEADGETVKKLYGAGAAILVTHYYDITQAENINGS
jgi:hypothetical protein